jgi:superfamily II DNA helicase RecQ
MLDDTSDDDSNSTEGEFDDPETSVPRDTADDNWLFDQEDPQYLQVQRMMKIPQIRETQARVLNLLHRRKSVLLLACTGWGKSLILQGLFHMNLGTKKPSRSIIVVFVPSSGLAQGQVIEINQRARELGAVKDVAIHYDISKIHLLDNVRDGEYQWVYLSPERALHPYVVGSLWDNTDFCSKILLFAVDEVHLVSDWGKNFRDVYSKLGKVRNMFGTPVPWFVTSATMPAVMGEEAMKSIGISEYTPIIAELDRPNLYYNIMVTELPSKYSGKGRTPMDFVMDRVRITKNKDDINKTIIYFNDTAQLMLYVERLRSLLPPELQASARQIIQMYFIERADQGKIDVPASFLIGTCRIICATEAFGMGKNIKDIIWVFQINPPRNVPQMMRRFGQAGRDPNLKAVCSLVLSKDWAGISSHDYQPKNKTQWEFKYRNETEIYNWVTAPCLRFSFLEFLSVSEQYTALPDGMCCSRCSERQRESNASLVFPAIGYEGICDIEVEKKRNDTVKARREALRQLKAKWKTPEKLQKEVFRELKLWRNRMSANKVFNHSLFVPAMIAPDVILLKLATNSRRIACESLLAPAVVTWATYEMVREKAPDDTVEGVITMVWERMKDELKKDELEKDESDAMEDKKLTAEDGIN